MTDEGENDIKRKVELWLVAELLDALPGMVCLPSSSEETPDPPFAFVKMTECTEVDSPARLSTRTVVLPGVYQVEVKVARVSHIDDTTSAAHSVDVRRFKTALRLLKDSIRALGGRAFYAPQKLVINGMEFVNTEALSDKTKQSHADIITLQLGVSG